MAVLVRPEKLQFLLVSEVQITDPCCNVADKLYVARQLGTLGIKMYLHVIA